MVTVNGVDYGDLGEVSAPAPGTFSSPVASRTGASSPAGVGSTDPVLSLWVLLGLEILVLIGLRRRLRRHNGG